jgi:NAD(P)-dependent dehydrogenase (short-subunit alcohol dehydrogenase family)
VVTLDPSLTSLEGRVAVVTGAARGIGAATALGLAAFGADVAVCDRDGGDLAHVAATIREQGRRMVIREMDVRDAEAVSSFAKEVGETWGRVDVLVNNAGGGFVAPFMEISPKGQRALVDENFTSVTHFVRAFVPLMLMGGSIVNVTSVEAFRAAPGFSIYAAMKAAVEQLTRTLALELAPRIRVNCVAPDAIVTPGDSELATRVGGTGDYGWKIPLGLGTPDDCAAAIVFLASDLARFITGTTIHVDGGSNAASGWRRRSQAEPYEP